MPAPTAYPKDETLTAIAIAVKNRSMIADQVLPRTTPMKKSTFKYRHYDDANAFTVPDTKVGRRSQVNEVDFGGTEITDSTEDFGLEVGLPSHDEGNEFDGTDLKAMNAEWLSELVMLDRELRVSGKVLAPATYAANTEALAPADQFTSPNADLIGLMLEKLDAPIVRANIAVFSEADWRAFRTHPQVAKAIHGNSGDSAIASRQQVAELLELDEVLVGRARVNTAKPGQAMDLQSAWGGGTALLHRDALAARMAGTTFGFTAQYDTKYASQWEDRNIGLRGGTRIRVGESVKEVICAAQLGYLLTNTAA